MSDDAAWIAARTLAERPEINPLGNGSGEPVWLYAYTARFWEAMGGLGPRATPTFHDGRPVTAADVIYSWQRAADPALASDTVLTYLGDIVGPEGDTQRYKELNRARTDFFRGMKFGEGLTLPGFDRPIFPASTGIGTDGRDIVMSGIAISTPRDDVKVVALENPQQVSAFDYDGRPGEAPLDERAPRPREDVHPAYDLSKRDGEVEIREFFALRQHLKQEDLFDYGMQPQFLSRFDQRAAGASDKGSLKLARNATESARLRRENRELRAAETDELVGRGCRAPLLGEGARLPGGAEDVLRQHRETVEQPVGNGVRSGRVGGGRRVAAHVRWNAGADARRGHGYQVRRDGRKRRHH